MSFFALLVSLYFLGLDRGDAFDVGCDYVDLFLHAAVKVLPGIFSVNATEKLLFLLLNFRVCPTLLTVNRYR